MTPAEPDATFVVDVLARTSGAACARARTLLGGEIDAPLALVDRQLVDAHLQHCNDCRAIAATLSSLVDDLPLMAEDAQDAGFTARVLAATSGRPRASAWYDRWLAWWSAAFARPRFAWEAAYALTLALVLVVGDPVRALESATSHMSALPRPRAAVTRTDRAMIEKVDTAFTWVEHRTEAVTQLLSSLRGDETTRSSAWYALADVTSRWARRALSWARPLIDAFRATSTEPAAAPVRSSDHTEKKP